MPGHKEAVHIALLSHLCERTCTWSYICTFTPSFFLQPRQIHQIPHDSLLQPGALQIFWTATPIRQGPKLVRRQAHFATGNQPFQLDGDVQEIPLVHSISTCLAASFTTLSSTWFALQQKMCPFFLLPRCRVNQVFGRVERQQKIPCRPRFTWQH